MESTIWIFCFISVVYIICSSSYPTRIKKLEGKVNKLDKKQRGGSTMSKIITSLVGESCKIRTEEALFFSGNVDLECKVLEADDEWIKISCKDKKGCSQTRIIRIDSISNIEILSKNN